MTIESQEARNLVITGDGVNPTRGQLFTAKQASLNSPLDPTIFADVYDHGGFVTMAVTGGELWFYFADNDTAEVDRGIGATDDGTTDAELGGHCEDLSRVRFFVPSTHPYFVRESNLNTTEVLLVPC